MLAAWEQFDEPVDRIVSIGAFEHFAHERYSSFFTMAYRALPADGMMLLHITIRPTFKKLRRQGLTLTRELIHFSELILTEIFRGGWLPTVPVVEERATEAGFTVTRIQSLQAHHARTLGTWTVALQANKSDAIAAQSPKVYDRHIKYPIGCAKLFHDGYINTNQSTPQRSSGAKWLKP